LPMIGIIDRVQVIDPQGRRRTATGRDRVCFGPTCDSVDRLPGELTLPADAQEGDYLVLDGMGAYSTATNTRFNGFGEMTIATVLSLH
jgi:ornithine decarboxylase